MISYIKYILLIVLVIHQVCDHRVAGDDLDVNMDDDDDSQEQAETTTPPPKPSKKKAATKTNMKVVAKKAKGNIEINKSSRSKHTQVTHDEHDVVESAKSSQEEHSYKMTDTRVVAKSIKGKKTQTITITTPKPPALRPQDLDFLKSIYEGKGQKSRKEASDKIHTYLDRRYEAMAKYLKNTQLLKVFINSAHNVSEGIASAYQVMQREDLSHFLSHWYKTKYTPNKTTFEMKSSDIKVKVKQQQQSMMVVPVAGAVKTASTNDEGADDESAGVKSKGADSTDTESADAESASTESTTTESTGDSDFVHDGFVDVADDLV